MKQSNQFGSPKLTCQMLKKLGIKQFESFKCPYVPSSYHGQYFFYEGNRIKLILVENDPKNSNSQKNTPQTIIFSKDGKTVYIVLSDHNKKRPNKDQYDNKKLSVYQYFQLWKGYRFVKNQQIYYGSFRQFNRQGQGVQVKIQELNEDIPFFDQLSQSNNIKMISVYSGEYLSNMRDTRPPNKALMQYYSINNQDYLITTKGYFKNGNQQGEHICQYFKTNVRKRVNYINGCITSKNADLNLLDKKLNTPTQAYSLHFSISYTNKTVKSLSEKQWLNPQVLDYFFRRIQFSHQCQHYNKPNIKNKPKPNVKFLSTTFFEKLVPSQMVSTLTYQINYESVNYLFGPFESLISFFQIYQLVVFPLNRDTHHFCLGAIISKIQRNELGKLQSAQFQIYNLDSIYEDQVISKRIISLFIKSIQNLSSYEKDIYEKAIYNAQIKTAKSLGATVQKNSYDCGVFTCMYGYLLYKTINQEKEQQINWNFQEDTITKIRTFLQNCLKYKYGDFMIRLDREINQQTNKQQNDQIKQVEQTQNNSSQKPNSQIIKI